MSAVSHHPRLPARLALDDTHVEVVDFEIGPPMRPTAENTLSAEERARGAQFVFERDRVRFTNARAGLREILGVCLGISPASIRLRSEVHGKPALDALETPLRFNLSHAGERALVALALGREVGIDLELIRDDIDHSGIAHSFFTPGEQAALERCASGDRLAAFYRCWVAKESYLKARGDGLSSNLDAFEVDLNASGGGLRWSTLDEPSRWRIEPIVLSNGYAGAVTCEEGDWTVRRWEGLGGH